MKLKNSTIKNSLLNTQIHFHTIENSSPKTNLFKLSKRKNNIFNLNNTSRTIKNYSNLTNYNSFNDNNNNKEYLSNSQFIKKTLKKDKPLKILYKNNFYPNSYKKQTFDKEVNQTLPMLLLSSSNFYSNNNNNSTNFYSNNNNNNNISINSNFDDDFSHSIDKYKNLYDNTKNYDYYTYDNNNNSINSLINENKITKDESLFIKKITKQKNKRLCMVNFNGKSKYISPKESLYTLKMNKAIMNKLNNVMNSTEFNFYNKKFNKFQYDKLKKYLMPKPFIKVLTFSVENNEFNEFQTDDKKSKKNINNNNNNIKIKTISSEKLNDMITLNKINNNRKITDIVIRNSLIKSTLFYYCKNIKQNNKIPNSRIQFTLNKYNNYFIIFGGLGSNILNDFWFYEPLKNEWKKITLNNEINYNFKYAHSSVLYNDCLYFFGGNININKLKYPMEDILIYNIINNQMKIEKFKREKGKYVKNYCKILFRRNHICEIIGWNMIVHGGIDLEKEYKNNDDEIDNENNNNNNDENLVLCDFMMLDLNNLKWSKLEGEKIKYKLYDKYNNKIKNNPNLIRRVYHSSCLVLNSGNLSNKNKLNIFYNEFTYNNNNNNNNNNNKNNNNTINNKKNFEPKFEGIYFFGGLNEKNILSNSLFILHIFKQPLICFEPKMNGIAPSPRMNTSMNYYKPLNYIIIYGGKNFYQSFNEMFICDIVNFNWIKVELFGGINENRSEHCSEIFGDKLYVFGGSNESNFLASKMFCIDLDLFKNKRYKLCYDYAKESIKISPLDKNANLVIKKIENGEEISNDVYAFLNVSEI